MEARFEEQHFEVDVVEDYKKNILSSDKTKLVDIQTTVEVTKKHTCLEAW
jgi:hypothetical protein